MQWSIGDDGAASLTTYDVPYGQPTIEELARDEVKHDRERSRPGCGLLLLTLLVLGGLLLIATGQG